jgi:hypothetical protein
MLAAIIDLEDRISDLQEKNPNEDLCEELDIFTVEASKEEPAINAVF